MLLTQTILLPPRKGIQRDSSLCFRTAQLLKIILRRMLKLNTIFNLELPHTAKNNLYMTSRDALFPSSLMRRPTDLWTNSMMDIFSIGQIVSTKLLTGIVAPYFSAVALVMIWLTISSSLCWTMNLILIIFLHLSMDGPNVNLAFQEKLSK